MQFSDVPSAAGRSRMLLSTWILILVAQQSTPQSGDDTVDEGAGAVAEHQLETLLETPGELASVPEVRMYGESDFAPYFATKMLVRAKRAFDQKQYRRARSLFKGEALPVRF